MAPWEAAVPQQHSEVSTQENKFVTKLLVGHVGHVLLGYTKPGRRWDVRDNECMHNFSGKRTLGRPRIKRKASLKTYPRHTVCEDRKYLDIMQYTGQQHCSVLALLYFWFWIRSLRRLQIIRNLVEREREYLIYTWRYYINRVWRYRMDWSG